MKIGQSYPEQGGIYAGIVAGEPNDFHIFVSDKETKGTFDECLAFVEQLNKEKDSGFSDWTLPSRAEQSLQFANLRAIFNEHYYWSREEFAGNSDYEWSILFYDGSRYYFPKDSALCARAVRRVAI